MTVEPRVAISQLAFPDTSFEEDIAIAIEVGIPGISPDENKLSDGSERSLSLQMDEEGISAALGTPSNLTVLPIFDPNMPPGPRVTEERVASIVAGLKKLAGVDTPVPPLFPDLPSFRVKLLLDYRKQFGRGFPGVHAFTDRTPSASTPPVVKQSFVFWHCLLHPGSDSCQT